MTSPASPYPYAHWMLREIHEQPQALTATLECYLDGGKFREGSCSPLRSWLTAAKRKIVVAASGSNRHAGMVAELNIDDTSGIAVDVAYASEYCYRSEKAMLDAGVLLVSSLLSVIAFAGSIMERVLPVRRAVIESFKAEFAAVVTHEGVVDPSSVRFGGRTVPKTRR